MTSATLRTSRLLIGCRVVWALILVLDGWVAVVGTEGGVQGADTAGVDVFAPPSADGDWTVGLLVCVAAAVGVGLGLVLLSRGAPSAVVTLDLAGALSVVGQAFAGRLEAFGTMALLAAGAGLLLTAPVRQLLQSSLMATVNGDRHAAVGIDDSEAP